MDIKYNIKEEYNTRAEYFYNLHHSSNPLILPNAWDAVSAKIFELEGFSALGTTSAGIASALGYADGELMSWEENLSSTRRIINAVNLPVSIDIEAGYADTVDNLVKNVDDVLKAGAVGINIEDGSCGESNFVRGVSEQAEKINAIRSFADSKSLKLFINARTDVFLNCGDSKIVKLYNAVRRANVYAEAGADCIFIPDSGDMDAAAIKTLVSEIDSPVNIIAGSNTPPVEELAQLGIARVSLGPRPMRASFDLIKRISRELLDKGTYKEIVNTSTTYNEVNNWFK